MFFEGAHFIVLLSSPTQTGNVEQGMFSSENIVESENSYSRLCLFAKDSGDRRNRRVCLLPE